MRPSILAYQFQGHYSCNRSTHILVYQQQDYYFCHCNTQFQHVNSNYLNSNYLKSLPYSLPSRVVTSKCDSCSGLPVSRSLLLQLQHSHSSLPVTSSLLLQLQHSIPTISSCYLTVYHLELLLLNATLILAYQFQGHYSCNCSTHILVYQQQDHYSCHCNTQLWLTNCKVITLAIAALNCPKSSTTLNPSLPTARSSLLQLQHSITNRLESLLLNYHPGSLLLDILKEETSIL
jgi:hypothetical protein